jgi:hypothetical protein
MLTYFSPLPRRLLVELLRNQYPMYWSIVDWKVVTAGESCPFGMILNLETARLTTRLFTTGLDRKRLYHCLKLAPRCLHCDMTKYLASTAVFPSSSPVIKQTTELVHPEIGIVLVGKELRYTVIFTTC